MDITASQQFRIFISTPAKTLTMTFKTSLGLSSVIITIAVTALFAFLIAGQYSLIKDAGHAYPIYTTIVCLVIYFLSFAFSPRKYLVTNDEIFIVRPLINACIKRSDITSVEQLDPSKIKLSFRRFGVGGIFGFYGNLVNMSLGRMTWYITRKDKLVKLRTKDKKKIILSPDETEQFINTIT
jgi:hypothetical protein